MVTNSTAPTQTPTTLPALALPVRDRATVRLRNALSARGAERRFRLGAVDATARLLPVPADFAPEGAIDFRVAGVPWRLLFSHRILLRAHPFFAEPELRGTTLEMLPEGLRSALAEKLAVPVFQMLSEALGAAVEFEGWHSLDPRKSGENDEGGVSPRAVEFELLAPGCPVTTTAALVPVGQTDADEAVDRLVALLAALPRGEEGLLASCAERIPLRLSTVAGSLELTHEEVQSLAAGDVLLPEWLPQKGAVKLFLSSSGRTLYEADGGLSEADTAVTLASAFRGVLETQTMISADDIPVTLTFEIDSRTITTGELKSLEAGYVFRLGCDPAAPVTVRANGLAVARGRLVDMNGVPGVELTEAIGAGAAPSIPQTAPQPTQAARAPESTPVP